MMIKAFSLALLAAVLACGSAQAQTGNATTFKNLKVTQPGSTGPIDGMSVLGRPLSARAQDEINAFDNGVVCDGVTDNAAALATIQGKLAPGKTVFFPPAPLPCMTTGPLSVTVSNVVIRAEPGTVTLKQAPGNTANVVLLSIGNASNVLINGLSFDGGGQDLGTTRNALQVFNGDNVVFDRVSVANTRGIGILFSQSKFSGVRRSSLRNVGNRWRTTLAAADRGQGVAFCCTAAGKTRADYPGNFIVDSSFSDIGLDAMSFTDGSNIVVNGNRCEMANSQFTQVSAMAYGACVYTSSAAGITVTGNYSYGASGNAFDLHDSKNFTLSSNYVMETGQAGLGVFSSYGAVSGNTVLNSGRWSTSVLKGGISLGGALSGVSVTGNLISDTESTPIQPFGIQGHTGSCSTCLISTNHIGAMATSAYGGYLTGPTLLPVSAGGTGLSGGAWAAWTPTLAATGGSDVTFSSVSAAYEQVGKTVRGRVTLAVNYTTAPTTFTFTLPGGQSIVSGGAIGSGANVSTSQAVQVASGSTTFTVRPLSPGGAFVSASGNFFVLSFVTQVQ